MIRLGNQSAFSAYPLTLPFDFALANGFEAFEWFPDKHADGAGWVAGDVSAAMRQEIRARARDAGICLSVRAPIHVDLLNSRTHGDLEDSFRLAVDLGAGLLNVLFSDRQRIEEFAQEIQNWRDRFSIAGVKLAIENLPSIGPDDVNRLFAMLPRNGVGFCFDVGHANLHLGTHNDYVGYLDRLRPDVPITHLHLHENTGERDDHLTLFTGPAGRDPSGIALLLERLAQREYSGCGILEQWPEPPELLLQARSRLQELMRRSASHE